MKGNITYAYMNRMAEKAMDAQEWQEALRWSRMVDEAMIRQVASEEKKEAQTM